jgi:hypothetical protein
MTATCKSLPPPNSSARWVASTILIANLATRFEFAQAHEQPDQEMQRLMKALSLSLSLSLPAFLFNSILRTGSAGQRPGRTQMPCCQLLPAIR